MKIVVCLAATAAVSSLSLGGCAGRVLLEGDAGGADAPVHEVVPDLSDLHDPAPEPLEEDSLADVPEEEGGELPPEAWARTYGTEDTEWLTSLRMTTDGGYIISGRKAAAGRTSGDMIVLRLNRSGEVIWEKMLDGGHDDYAYGVSQGPGGAYYILAGTSTFSPSETNAWWIMRLGETGSPEWFRRYGVPGGDRANDVHVTSDGGAVIAGETWSQAVGGLADVWIMKIDQAGNTAWQRVFGFSSHYDDALSVWETADGGFVAAAYIRQDHPVEGNRLTIAKLDGDGRIVWHRVLRATFGASARSVRQTPDGGYIVAGETQDREDVRNAAVVRFDPEGDILWQRTYPGAGDGGRAICCTSDGGFAVAGGIQSGDGNDDIWVLKLDGEGNIAWQKRIGGQEEEEADSIEQTADGGYVIGGSTRSFGAGDLDFWVVKLDPGGNIPADCPPGMIEATNVRAEQGTMTAIFPTLSQAESSAGAAERPVTELDTRPGVEVQCSL